MIVLTILKVIGIVLLALLCLLLLILAVVLLSPIRYEGAAEKYAHFAFSARVKWLVLSFAAEKKAQDKDIDIQIKIFGRTPGKKKKKTKKAKAEPAAPAKAPELSAAEYVPPQTYQPSAAVRPAAPPPKPEFREAPPSKAKEAGQVRRIRLEDIAEEAPAAEDLVQTDKAAAEEKLSAQYFIQMPLAEKKALISIAFGFLKKLLRHVSPQQLLIEGTVGTGDVESTGYVLALCGVLKAGLGNSLQIKGNFTTAMAEGKIRAAGRIRIGTVLCAVLAAAVKKPVRKIIKLAWKGLGEKRG